MDENTRIALDVARLISQQIEAGQVSGVVRVGAVMTKAEQFRRLLEERVLVDELAVLTEDGPMCNCCYALWEYDADSCDVRPGSEWHHGDCWVVRVRAALNDDTTL